jgi:hypothetical protein
MVITRLINLLSCALTVSAVSSTYAFCISTPNKYHLYSDRYRGTGTTRQTRNNALKISQNSVCVGFRDFSEDNLVANEALRILVSESEAETIRQFTCGNHHCAWKADPYTKNPDCPHKAVTNQLFADACADSAASAGFPISSARFLVLDAAHASTSAALEARGSNRHLIFVPNLYPATVHSLRASGLTSWMGDVRSFLLRHPPPPPFFGIYLDACGSVKRYASTIMRILGVPDISLDESQPLQPLIGMGHGVHGIFAITLDHRDPQEPGTDAMESFFAIINDAAERSRLRIDCLTACPPAEYAARGREAAALGHGHWVRERGGAGPGGAYSYDGMFFALFRVTRSEAASA